MKARVSWLEGRTFRGETDSGQAILTGRAHGEGAKPGPTPMELILIGAGGCSAYDVVEILEKMRQPVADCVVELDADRAETAPKVFTRIDMRFVVTGRGLDPAKVARAVSLSVDKYCSATAMLSKTAAVTHDFEVVETD